MGDHPLPFPEQVRQDTAIDNRHVMHRVGNQEAHRNAVVQPFHGAGSDQSAKAETAVLGDRLLGKVGGAAEEQQIVLEGHERQAGGGAEAEQTKGEKG